MHVNFDIDNTLRGSLLTDMLTHVLRELGGRSMAPLDTILILLTVIATAVMAASGSLQGVRQGFDPFGTAVLAVTTAVGGGTVRDFLIGATPVFWMEDMTYLLIAIPVSLAAYFVGRRLKEGTGKRNAALQYLDAIGLGLFTLVGVQAGLDAQVPFLAAIILGCVTGVVGGMIRDILCGLTPTVLKQDLYATISLLGGMFYILLSNYVRAEISLVAAFLFIVILRFYVIWRRTKHIE